MVCVDIGAIRPAGMSPIERWEGVRYKLDCRSFIDGSKDSTGGSVWLSER